MGTLIQSLRRLGQRVKYMDQEFDSQWAQLPLAKKMFARHGFHLVLTGSAYPEQYEVWKGEVLSGYLRLRGDFTVEYPDCGGKLLLELSPDGDGMFEAHERLLYLSKGLRAILKEMRASKSIDQTATQETVGKIQ